MNTVALFLILGKKTQGFAFNVESNKLHYQQPCAAHPWVAAGEQAVSCLQCSWTGAEPVGSNSHHT